MSIVTLVLAVVLALASALVLVLVVALVFAMAPILALAFGVVAGAGVGVGVGNGGGSGVGVGFIGVGLGAGVVKSHVRSGEASSHQWWSGQSVVPQLPRSGSHDGDPSIAQGTGVKREDGKWSRGGPPVPAPRTMQIERQQA